MTEQDRKEYISDLTEVRDNLKGISGGLFSGRNLTTASCLAEQIK